MPKLLLSPGTEWCLLVTNVTVLPYLAQHPAQLTWLECGKSLVRSAWTRPGLGLGVALPACQHTPCPTYRICIPSLPLRSALPGLLSVHLPRPVGRVYNCVPAGTAQVLKLLDYMWLGPVSKWSNV